MTDLFELSVPGPTVTDLTAPFWDAVAKGILLVQRCEACKKAILYPREIFPHCWGTDMAWDEASGYGRLNPFRKSTSPDTPAGLRRPPITLAWSN